MSRRLSDRSVDHVVLERGEVAHTWRTERWEFYARGEAQAKSGATWFNTPSVTLRTRLVRFAPRIQGLL